MSINNGEVQPKGVGPPDTNYEGDQMKKMVVLLALASAWGGAMAADESGESSAGRVAEKFLASRFIAMGAPNVHGDSATVAAQVAGQKCKVELRRDMIANPEGWRVQALDCAQGHWPE